jgi:L-alanine-DL-glutamate epimerase-like enolase superfamily enzyme
MLPDGLGFGGVGNMAAAILDIAVWDLAGKAAGLPLYRLLGGYRNRVPAYASLRLSRAIPTAELPEIAGLLVEQGFRAMKMNLGGQPSIDGEIARVRAVREAIGPEISLLADVNSRWTPSEAVRMGRLIDDFRLFWLEDPVPIQNLEGLAEVRRATHTPIATGETLFSLASFRSLFEARAVDVPMPDLVRVGGITPYLKIAHLAEAFGLPLACHLLPEISAQVVAAVPNGLIVEYVPWAWQLFRNCPQLDHGNLVLSERPGHGLELDADFVEQHRRTD